MLLLVKGSLLLKASASVLVGCWLLLEGTACVPLLEATLLVATAVCVLADC